MERSQGRTEDSSAGGRSHPRIARARRAPVVVAIACAVAIATTARALPPGWYAPPEDAKYATEEVRVRSEASLAGTLTLPSRWPATAGKRLRFPAVVMITAAGPQNRDHTPADVLASLREGTPAYRPYYDLADTLARRGIASLRLDDRGVGASMGMIDTTQSLDRSVDTRAALDYLRARGEIDPRRIVLVGLGEGALNAMLVAAGDSAVRGVVLMGCPAVPAGTGAMATLPSESGHNPGSASARDSALGASRTQDAGDPWAYFSRLFDPLGTARLVRVPALVLQGGDDEVLPRETAARLSEALRQSGNRDVTTHTFEGVTHEFLRTGAVTRGVPADSTSFHPPDAVLGAIADWVAQRAGGPIVTTGPNTMPRAWRRAAQRRKAAGLKY
jgi:dienelactone hydrolase